MNVCRLSRDFGTRARLRAQTDLFRNLQKDSSPTQILDLNIPPDHKIFSFLMLLATLSVNLMLVEHPTTELSASNC